VALAKENLHLMAEEDFFKKNLNFFHECCTQGRGGFFKADGADGVKSSPEC
jgi:hypothetical protein